MSLVPRWRLGDLYLTDYPYSVRFGADYGAPENVTDILRSLLTDGDLEVTSRRGNRTVTLPVLLEGGDLGALADAEAALWAEVDAARNELWCDPGDGLAAPFVLDVFRGSMVLTRDDDYEQAGYRAYTLTFKALPWVRSATETTVPALAPPPGVPTSATVDDGSSATGWTGFADYTPTPPSNPADAAVTPTSTSGAIQMVSTASRSTAVLTLTRTGSVTTSATKYLVVDWTWSGGASGALTAKGDGIALSKLTEGASPTAGYTRTTFEVGSAVTSVAALEFILTSGWASGTASAVARTFRIDNIDRTDTLASSSSKQQLRSLDIGGSAPTIGSIAVEHASSALGDDTMIYTFAAHDGAALAYSPYLRGSGYRVSGPTQNADATAVTGFNVNIDTVETFDIPVSALPEGVYLVMARLKSATSAPSVTWTVTPRLNSVAIGSTSTTATTVALGGSVWKSVRLGMVTLPPADVTPSSTAVVRFTAVATVPASYDVLVDEVWLLNVTIGRLTQVDLGTAAPSAGGSSNRLWIDSPSVENGGLGKVWRGYSADRSDAFSAFAVADSADIHEFPPGPLKMLSVTPNVAAPDVSFAYAARWHTHPAA